MRVCLVRPPKYMIDGAPRIPVIPPLGIALIAARLIEDGHEVTVVDAVALAPSQFQEEDVPLNLNGSRTEGFRFISMGLSFEEVAQQIPADTDVIGVGCMFSINWPLDRAFVGFCARRFPKSVIIAGGESVSGMAELTLEQAPGLTAVVLGEGEETTSDLMRALKAGIGLDTVQGLVFRNGDGSLARTPRRSRMKSLDEMPYPAWHLFPLKNYERHWASPTDKAARLTLSILATRGCPYQCTFCTSPDMWGTRYYVRSPENVLEELLYMKQRFGATNFEFRDLTAIIKKEWIVAFANLLIASGEDITWRIPSGTRSEAIDEEVADLLRRSGCYFITYAPESGSPRLLKEIKKKVSLPNMLRSMTWAKKHGMTVYSNIILGLPGERHADVWHTLVFLVRCGLVGIDDTNVFMFRPYPGSVMFDKLLEQGKIDLSDDGYFVDSLFLIDSLIEHRYYNEHVSSFWYRLYMVLAFICFYGARFIVRPSVLLTAIRNQVTGQYSTELGRKLVNPVKRLTPGTGSPAVRPVPH